MPPKRCNTVCMQKSWIKIAALCPCAVKDEMHVKTLALHSDMKTPEDEAKTHEQWQLARDTAAKRSKKAGPLMRCPCCDAHQLAQ